MKKMILAAMITGLLVFSAGAQQAAPSASATSPSGILAKFNGLILSDLQNAEAIAKAAGDTIADQCYLAVIVLVQQMNAVSAQASGASTSLANVQLVTAFEKARLIINAQRTTSPIFAACAPLKAQLKSDSLTAPGALLSLF